MLKSINKSSYPNELPPFLKRRCSKVIASTDKSLGLSSISDKDLQYYTKSYNEGNIIIEWEVEMTSDELEANKQGLSLNGGRRLFIKTTPDNNVIIK